MKGNSKVKILIKKDPRYPLDIGEIRRMTQKILRKFSLKDKVKLSLNFVGKRKAEQLNIDYRKVNYVPEVLAFPMHDKEPDGFLHLGDVVVCFPLARNQAMKRKRMVNEIIEELLEHGIRNIVKS